MTNNRDISDPDFRFPSLSTHHIFTNIASSSSCPDPNHYINRNPKKKRSKVVKVDDGNSNNISKPKITKKPDPSAPKITRPCTECGKKFWSWKALFGHMRCHPEREWRGINPPPNARRSVSNRVWEEVLVKDVVQRNRMTVEDHEVASCLLMLANGANYVNVSVGADSGSETDSFLLLGGANSKFECSSCKKVFGSHQALGGHRASHKNVKGCFAITKNEGCEIDYQELDEGENDINHNSDSGHRCSICLKVFSSGQALGGHKRCHWEKGEEEDQPLMIMTSNYNQGPDFVDARLRTGKEGGNLALDLNRPAPIEDDSFSVSSSYSTGLTLDLRLGL